MLAVPRLLLLEGAKSTGGGADAMGSGAGAAAGAGVGAAGSGGCAGAAGLGCGMAAPRAREGQAGTSGKRRIHREHGAPQWRVVSHQR